MPNELEQVLRGLALNRTPGWNFPGNFLQVSFDEVAADRATLSLEPGPHCVDTDGNLSLAALSVLTDIGLAAAMRHEVGLGTRMATVMMAIQLTGAPLAGRVQSRGRLDGIVPTASGNYGLLRTEIHAGGALCATATGSFMSLGNRAGTAPLPLRRRGVDPVPEPLRIEELAADERAVYERALGAVEPGPACFLERFWNLLPGADDTGAVTEFTNGLHVGNRIGHTQGGLTFALAALTGRGALDDAWALVGVTAYYVSPGTGPSLRAEARIVHKGSLTAVVRIRIADAEGRTVMEAMTHHARRA